ncbi:DUF4252 domain-containing protein [Puteibacter caeruleilacunae]|nr:DUF4252 domain-containing protein [Puteibacter caeruleilacunae]
MRTLIIIIICLLPVVSTAKQHPTDKLFEQYSGEEGVTTVTVPGLLIWFASWFIDSDEDPEVKEILDQINSVRVLTIEDDHLNKKTDFFAELTDQGQLKEIKKCYSPLLEVNEEGERVGIFGLDGKNGNFKELLIIVGGDENTIVSMKGDIDLAKIGSLSEALDMKQLSPLKQLETK